MINNIHRHHKVTIYVLHNTFKNIGPKWPIHVIQYGIHPSSVWPSEIYEEIEEYEHPLYGRIMVLINKNTYIHDNNSCIKSARK